MKPIYATILLLLTTSVFGHKGVSEDFYDYKFENENLYPKTIVCDIEEGVTLDIDYGMNYSNFSGSAPGTMTPHRFEYQGKGIYKRLYHGGNNLVYELYGIEGKQEPYGIEGKQEPHPDEIIFRAQISKDSPLMFIFQVPKYEGDRGVNWVFQLDKLSSSHGIRQEYRDGRFTEKFASMWNTGTCKYSQRE